MTSESSGVIAVLRTNSAADALTLGRALADTSVIAIEVTMTVPDAPKVIEQLIGEGIKRVGAGTVRTVDQVKQLAKIGANFVVSPHLDIDVVKAAVDHGIPTTPGCLSPSEMVRAMQLGASSVKVFPINSVGGLDFVNFVLEPLPDLPIVVSGGVTPEQVNSYLSAGVVGVCLGGKLWLPEIVSTGDVAKAKAYAENALAKIAQY
ncbi:MAG: bifunctional 4-hydroxy-2-oxoglutarate aldolase/2-dehydro-3-deoxy-phosphogluconate aldolase [Candidatus Nanopelagicales bacterium]